MLPQCPTQPLPASRSKGRACSRWQKSQQARHNESSSTGPRKSPDRSTFPVQSGAAARPAKPPRAHGSLSLTLTSGIWGTHCHCRPQFDLLYRPQLSLLDLGADTVKSSSITSSDVVITPPQTAVSATPARWIRHDLPIA
ncbi:hypothetical protein LIA77_08301 [Sarocladium implicatum]|jgi:hypothetical protein|nr:hypothetical protein LIA77_08301 [Sarocladium implicatum]